MIVRLVCLHSFIKLWYTEPFDKKKSRFIQKTIQIYRQLKLFTKNTLLLKKYLLYILAANLITKTNSSLKLDYLVRGLIVFPRSIRSDWILRFTQLVPCSPEICLTMMKYFPSKHISKGKNSKNIWLIKRNFMSIMMLFRREIIN